jgi:putative FmdB family regulatory protein
LPIYEYRCADCGRGASLLARTYDAPPPPCPHCGRAGLERLISRVALLRSEDDLGPPQADGGYDYYRDDRNIGRWTKKRLADLGVDLGPQVDEVIEKARDGSLLKEMGERD